ncbi:MAG TPA: membrane dipeptidase [Patescibacteria group bacterium]|nr:membrane dipeptidase [Patescibacteria group bacterium]
MATAAAAGVGITAGVVFGVVPDLVARTKNPVRRRPPYPASEGARELHRTLEIVDLHADTLLWGRDLLVRAGHSHVDVPRLIDGGIAIEGLAVSTKVPRRANMERNDDRTDDVTLLAIAQRWPPSTLRSLLARALYHADRARSMADRSDGRFALIDSRSGLDAYRVRRTTDRSITAAFLAIEGAHALEDDPSNVDRLIAAGFRMLSPTHFFDNAFGGSAHGVAKGGLTPLGRELVARMEAGAMIVDVAHASEATIDDVLAVATRPVVASHTGVRASHDVTRNLADAHVRGIAATGGLVGIGFWPTATGGDDPASIARSVRAAVGLVGVDHVGLGSDFDGGVPVPFDATGIVQITDRLLGDGFTDEEIARIMGGNALRVLAATLPE